MADAASTSSGVPGGGPGPAVAEHHPVEVRVAAGEVRYRQPCSIQSATGSSVTVGASRATRSGGSPPATPRRAGGRRARRSACTRPASTPRPRAASRRAVTASGPCSARRRPPPPRAGRIGGIGGAGASLTMLHDSVVHNSVIQQQEVPMSRRREQVAVRSVRPDPRRRHRHRARGGGHAPDGAQRPLPPQRPQPDHPGRPGHPPLVRGRRHGARRAPPGRPRRLVPRRMVRSTAVSEALGEEPAPASATAASTAPTRT